MVQRGDARFGLLIEKHTKGGESSFNISSSNTGIPDIEIIVYLEAWLEKFKEHVKAPIQDSILFLNSDEVFKDGDP
jgi:hypothetical protein